MSRPQNRSKDSYQGLNVRRLPRSELDDNTMRDLNRFDNRLDHNLRNVEKAKGVMLRSLEKDKSIFLRGGIRSNKKYTVSIQNPGDSRQRRDSTSSQPSTTSTTKYHSDTRNKKSTMTHQSSNTATTTTTTTTATTTAPQSEQQDAAATSSTTTGYRGSSASGGRGNGSKQSGKEHNNDYKNTYPTTYYNDYSGNVRDIFSEPRDVIDNKQNVRDLEGEGRLVGAGSSKVKSEKPSAESRASNHRTDTTSGLESRVYDYPGHQGHYDSSGYNSITPTIHVDEYQTPVVGASDNGQLNGKSTTSGGNPCPFYDDLSSYGKRRPHFWERMSTPKNPSLNLQKREQLEREFSSAAIKSRATTPAAPKSAKGPRTLISSTSGTTGTTLLMTSPAASSGTATSGKSGTRKKSSPVQGASSVKTKPKSSIKGK